MSYQIELFHSLLNDFLNGESALLTLDGNVLAVRGVQPATYGTLNTAALTAHKYLNLQEGDIAILNDPYSGGSTLDEMTFVMAISEDLLWVVRKSLGKSVKISNSVEEEGLRIPPTPLLQKGQMNEVIMMAMQAHPACPPGLTEWLKTECQMLQSEALKLIEAIEFAGFDITAELIEDYLKLCRERARQIIAEKASGETRADIVLDSGELLRLNMEIHEGKIIMDFSGTSAAKTVWLTESATFGACYYAISRFYGFADISNSGTFSAVQIIKPTNCWLVAKYPAPISKGLVSGISALKSAIGLALSQIHRKHEKSLSCHCPLEIELQHQGRQMAFSIPGGEGATKEHDGQQAHIKYLSIEQLERELPVKVLRIDTRLSNGGKGKYSGGRGLLLKLEALQDTQLTWLTDLTLHRPRLPKECSHGDPTEIVLERSEGKNVLPVLGSQILAKGDTVVFCTGSGGGFGRAEPS